MKDRWLAVNLSWTILGLGQFGAGRRIAGSLWLALHILFLGTWLAWAWIPEVGTGILAGSLVAFLPVRIACAVHAWRCARAEPPPSGTGTTRRRVAGNPWKAVFFGRLFPGLGQACARRWIRLAVVLVLFGAWAWWEKPAWLGDGGALLDAAFWSLILLDAFWVLRRKNVIPKGWTALCLALMLPVSGTWPLAKITKAFLFEFYHVPATSMSPTIREGDRVLSNRCGLWFRPVERFDVAVFRFPLDESMAFVKRVVGLPGEEFQIRHGEIFVRPKGESRFRIARKPPYVQERLWIDPAEGADFLRDEAAFRGAWGTWGPSSAGGGRLSIPAAEAKFRFLPGIGDAGGAAGDLRLSLDLRMTGAREEVWAEVGNYWGRFVARLSGDSDGTLVHSPRESSKVERAVPLAARLVRGRVHAFELEVCDGRASVRFDGALLGGLAFLEFLEEDRGLAEVPTSLSFGARGDGLTVDRLAVGRDLHYQGRRGFPEGVAVAIPEGAYFVLGDNVPFSHDSRGWTRWTYRLKGRADPVECEGHQTTDGAADRAFLSRLAEKYRLSGLPDIGIRSDRSGKERYLFRGDLEGDPQVEPFRFIPRRFITGRVVRVWWPPRRAGPVR